MPTIFAALRRKLNPRTWLGLRLLLAPVSPRRVVRRRAFRVRAGSFPFISGDTYRMACEYIVETPAQLHAFLTRDSVPAKGSRLFVSTEMSTQLLEFVPDDVAIGLHVVIHNGDVLSDRVLKREVPRFASAASVNWLGDHSFMLPLPIGLENAWMSTNGKLSHFSRCIPSRRRELVAASRPDVVLIAFNDKTNFSVRREARRAFVESGLPCVVKERISPQRHQRHLQNALFTLSPPGHGPDCHRTWEAMYQGCIPIVLRSAWPFSDEPWPVLAVADWNEAVELLRDNPQETYAAIQSRSMPTFYADHILASLSEFQNARLA